MAISLRSPMEVRQDIRDRLKARRLAMNLTQAGLAKRSGVSLGTLKRFETTGQVSIDSLLSLALVLECLADFEKLAVDDPRVVPARSLDEILSRSQIRKKGRLK